MAIPSPRAYRRGILSFLAGGLLVLAGLIGIDLRDHVKFADGSFNVAGYRGAVLGAKAPNELRLGVVGGSTVFGYGVTTPDALPAQLQDSLGGALKQPVSVVNLGANGDSSVCFASTLDQFRYLQLDAVLIYSGDNDLVAGVAGRDPRTCVRNRSVIFDATGYMPVLFETLGEKYFHLRYPDWNQGLIEFQAVAVDRAAERAKLQDAQQLEEATPFGLTSNARSQPAAAAQNAAPAVVCAPGMAPATDADAAAYVRHISALVTSQLGQGVKVMVGLEPPMSEAHCAQEATLTAGLAAFKGSAGFSLFAATGLNVKDPSLSFDGMHLTSEGNHQLAEELRAPVAQLLTSPASTPPAATEAWAGKLKAGLLHGLGRVLHAV